MSRLLTRLPDPHDPTFWVAAGIAAAALVVYAGVVLAIALCSKNKKRRKRARKRLRQLFGGGR